MCAPAPPTGSCSAAAATLCAAAHIETVLAACRLGHIGIVRLLVQHGADVNGRGANDTTPLLAAVRSDCDDVVRLLLSLGAEPPAALAQHALERHALCSWMSIVAWRAHAVGADDWALFLERRLVSAERDLWAFMMMLSIDAVPCATAFAAPEFFVAACWWGLPVVDALVPATQTRAFAMMQHSVAKQYAALLQFLETQRVDQSARVSDLRGAARVGVAGVADGDDLG